MTYSLKGAVGPAVWSWVSRFGQAEVMLPCVIALAVWMIWTRAGHKAWAWVASLLAAAGLTLVTKVAFIGWGVGIASLDFTGISGHAMLSAATWPMILSVLAATVSPGLAAARGCWRLWPCGPGGVFPCGVGRAFAVGGGGRIRGGGPGQRRGAGAIQNFSRADHPSGCRYRWRSGWRWCRCGRRPPICRV